MGGAAAPPNSMVDPPLCGKEGGEGVWEGRGEGVWEGRGEVVREGGEERVCGRGGEGWGGDKHPSFHIGLVLLVYIVLGSMPLSVTTKVTI